MNAWLASASVLLVAGLFPVVWGVATGSLGRRVVAQNFGTSVVCLVMLLLAQGYDRPAYTDLALVLAVLGPVGTLVYARLLADELGEAPPKAQLPTVLAAAATVPVVIASCVAMRPGAGGGETCGRGSSARRRKRDLLTDSVRRLPGAERGPT